MKLTRDSDQGELPSGSSVWDDSGIAQQQFPSGLYVVATPVGNAADVTLRALWILRMADCIAAEDTRTTAPLLARYGIDNRLVALHQHNEEAAARPLLERLERGERVALVSDAGTPAISDPGALLVRAALAAGLRVIPVPGASSLTAALSVAGVRTADIRFLGFAPARGPARRRYWAQVAAAAGATVIFEAPHRLAATARDISEVLEPARRIVLMRELSKKFETVVQTTAAGLAPLVESSAARGEYVLVIDAPVAGPAASAQQAAGDALDPVTLRWLAELARELPASRAAAVAARATGLPRELLYRRLEKGASDA